VVATALCLACAALPAAGAGRAQQPDPDHPWAGQWSSSFGGFAFRVTTAADGRALLEQIGGKACAGSTEYYAGGYNDPDDQGKIRGCTQGRPDHLVGRFESNKTGQGGSFDVTRSGSTWKGTWSSDGGGGGSWQGSFLRHFEGDGAGTPDRIQDAEAYRVFFGLDDPDRPAWGSWLVGLMRDYVKRVSTYPKVTADATIPGESYFSTRHSPHLLFGGSDLRVLLGQSDAPADLVGGNVYARVTVRFEARLRSLIERSGGNLLPADVAVKALQVTGGSYPLAVLTAHNLLKNVTMAGRSAIDDAGKAYGTRQAKTQLRRSLAALERENRVVSKLQSLRRDPDGAQASDKMGPWYHTFAVLAAGALVDSTTAKTIVVFEHGFKLASLFKGEGGFNKEKATIDTCWALVTGQSELEELSRYDLLAEPTSLLLCAAAAGR
jgi:hypothetical protein